MDGVFTCLGEILAHADADADPDAALRSVHVVVAWPEEIGAWRADGPRMLYVALTRCTQSLTVVYGDGLPPGLDSLLPEVPVQQDDPSVVTPLPPTPEARVPSPRASGDADAVRDELRALSESLTDDDVRLLASIAQRFASAAALRP